LPPRRFLEEPLRSGPFAGAQLDLQKWNRLLDDYYELHGWDQATGWQTRSCLEELRLPHVAAWKAGRLLNESIWYTDSKISYFLIKIDLKF
jgi:hypothetical protein